MDNDLSDHEALLCVGGRHNGGRALIQRDSQSADVEVYALYPPRILHSTIYVRQAMGDVTVLVPDGQSLRETLRLLVDGYQGPQHLRVFGPR